MLRYNNKKIQFALTIVLTIGVGMSYDRNKLKSQIDATIVILNKAQLVYHHTQKKVQFG